MGHMKKFCDCSNFGLIEIVRHKVTSFVSQKYDKEDDILVSTYCKITKEISISSVYFKQKMVFSKSHCKQFFDKTNLEFPFQHQNGIKKKPRENGSFKKQ